MRMAERGRVEGNENALSCLDSAGSDDTYCRTNHELGIEAPLRYLSDRRPSIQPRSTTRSPSPAYVTTDLKCNTSSTSLDDFRVEVKAAYLISRLSAFCLCLDWPILQMHEHSSLWIRSLVWPDPSGMLGPHGNGRTSLCFRPWVDRHILAGESEAVTSGFAQFIFSVTSRAGDSHHE